VANGAVQEHARSVAVATTPASTRDATAGPRFPHRTGKDYLPPGYYTMEPRQPHGWLDDLHLCAFKHGDGPHSSPGLNCDGDGTCRCDLSLVPLSHMTPTVVYRTKSSVWTMERLV
jgi:hypothetical protein